MNVERLSFRSSLSGWMAGIGEHVRTLFAGQREANDPGPSVDPDFHGWVANDPMTTFNPASRYGDDATGFLRGADSDEPDPVWKDD